MDTATLAAEVMELDLSGLKFMTVSEACQIFIYKHVQLFNKYAPILTKSIRETTAPRYMSDDTKRLVTYRDNLYAIHKTSPSHLTQTRLRILNNLIKIWFRRDCRNKIDNDIKKNGVWKTKKYLFSQNRSNDFDPDILNDFFAGVSNEEVNCTCPANPYTIFDAKFQFTKVTIHRLIKLYNKLKTRSRTTHDSTDFAPIMLKYTIGSPTIAQAITDIVNRSLMCGEFPYFLKTGTITPIPKIDALLSRHIIAPLPCNLFFLC